MRNNINIEVQSGGMGLRLLHFTYLRMHTQIRRKCLVLEILHPLLCFGNLCVHSSISLDNDLLFAFYIQISVVQYVCDAECRRSEKRENPIFSYLFSI